MTQATVQKKGSLTPPQYLRLVPIERTPEQALELEFREGIVALEVDGERPKRLYKIADGSLVPLRVLARVMRDALMAEVDPMALYRAIMKPIERFIAKVAKRRTPTLPTRPDQKYLPAA